MVSKGPAMASKGEMLRDMAEAARHLAEVLETGEWQRGEFQERAAVT